MSEWRSTPTTQGKSGMLSGLRLYLDRQSSSLLRYFYEQFFLVCFGWIPTVFGIGLRSVF